MVARRVGADAAAKPLGTVGAVIVVVMVAAAALADLLSPYGFAQTSLSERFIAMNGRTGSAPISSGATC